MTASRIAAAGFVPGERLGAQIVLGEVAVDGGLQIDDAEEGAMRMLLMALSPMSPRILIATSLGILFGWPRLDLASKLVFDHAADWNGGYYKALAPAADSLGKDHPVAATVLYRELIDDILAKGRSQAYGHAAGYFTTLAFLASDGFATPGLMDHHAYVDALGKAHGRNFGFWGLPDRK